MKEFVLLRRRNSLKENVNILLPFCFVPQERNDTFYERVATVRGNIKFMEEMYEFGRG